MTRRPRRPLAALASSLIVFAGLGAAACAPAYGTIVSSSATLGETDTTDPTAGESETWGTTSDACECGPEEACIDGACVDVGRGAIEAGCHPLSQGVCLYPWPSDFTTRPDPEASTGLRLDYDPELLPKNLNGVAFAADEVTARVDGFSPNSQLRFVSPRGVASADLVGIDDIDGSLADDATIVLIAADTGERQPYFAEVDVRAPSPDRQAVFVRPMKRLAFGTRYIVAARGLHDAEGAPIAPSPLFLALRDQLPTDLPQLEALRPAYEELFADLEAAGVARDELVLAWDFTTTSQQSLISDAAAIMPQVKAAAEGGALGYTIDSVVDQDGPVGRVIRGTFKAPNCMTGDAAPGSLLRRDAMGKPECSGTVDAPFVIAVPEAVLNGVESAPAAVYGHGLLGSGDEAVSVAALTGSVILVGTDWWGMAEEDIPNVASVLLDNFANSYSLPERLLQSVVNFTTLAYLLHGELAEDQALYADKIKLIDTAAPVNYIGGSQGGIMGGTTVALAPNLDRGVLVVGGANYSLMVWRSTSFAAVNDLWEGSQPDELDREFLFALYQSAFDLSDPVIYSELIRDAPLPGNAPKQLLLIEAIGDSQVPNIATEAMARSYGMLMLGAAIYPVFGVPTLAGPIDDLALLQVDTKKGPLPPKQNIPGDSDNGAHGASADGIGVQKTIQVFLEKGELINMCEGACDPD